MDGGAGRQAPFDALAGDYDRAFTHGVIGSAMRRAVWRRLDTVCAAGARVLELGCGTGEDAVHLAARGARVVAIDASPAMVERTLDKAAAAGVGDRIEARTLAIERLHSLDPAPPFDGVFSDFGALNCVADLAAVRRALAPRVRPGGWLMLCVMGPWVPWEQLWYLLRGQPATAFRRLRPAGVRWRGLRVRYPSPRAVRRAFAPAFRTTRSAAVGALVPPSYAESWARRHPRLLAALERWERRFETRWPLVWSADHFLIELERRRDQ